MPAISTDYLQARRLLTGVVDPSGLGLVFSADGNRVFAHADANDRICGRAKVVPASATQGVLDDAAHAAVASLKRRVGITREARVRYLKPLYASQVFRVDATLAKEALDLFTVQVRVFNAKDQLCVEADVDVFALTAEQVRRMVPDGVVASELRRYLP